MHTRTHTHTHAHMHIYIYIYIYIALVHDQWQAWKKIRTVITSSHNAVIQRVSKSFPDGRIPSGKDVGIYFEQLMNAFYVEEKKNTETISDELGGSPAKVRDGAWRASEFVCTVLTSL